MRKSRHLNVTAEYYSYKSEIYKTLLAFKISERATTALMKKYDDRIQVAFGPVAKAPVMTAQVVARLIVQNYWENMDIFDDEK